MAVLIERSQNKLRELRVGISSKAVNKDFVQAWDNDGLHQVDHRALWPGESTISDRRLGGVLGILVGRIYDIRRKPAGAKAKDKQPALVITNTSASSTPTVTQATLPTEQSSVAGVDGEDGAEDGTLATGNGASGLAEQSGPSTAEPPPLSTGSTDIKNSKPSRAKSQKKASKLNETRPRLEGKLRLETLELERVPLSIQVCIRALDWSLLTSLTILDCPQHENLWKHLRRHFQPSAVDPASGRTVTGFPLQYQLSLKKIHADVTTAALITFIKETLAPNTLEVLFLQDNRRVSPQQGINTHIPLPLVTIFNGAIKRHHSSLQKLLLDSYPPAARPPVVPPPNVPPPNVRWIAWALTEEFVDYVTSGRMKNLKELSVSLDRKTWVSQGRLPGNVLGTSWSSKHQLSFSW